MDTQPPVILNLCTKCGWSASRPGRFNPEERAPGIHSVAGRVNLTAGLAFYRQYLIGFVLA